MVEFYMELLLNTYWPWARHALSRQRVNTERSQETDRGVSIHFSVMYIPGDQYVSGPSVLLISRNRMEGRAS